MRTNTCFLIYLDETRSRERIWLPGQLTQAGSVTVKISAGSATVQRVLQPVACATLCEQLHIPKEVFSAGSNAILLLSK